MNNYAFSAGRSLRIKQRSETKEIYVYRTVYVDEALNDV